MSTLKWERFHCELMALSEFEKIAKNVDFLGHI